MLEIIDDFNIHNPPGVRLCKQKHCHFVNVINDKKLLY